MNELIEYTILLDLGVLFLVAVFCGTVFKKLKMPPVIGMLIAGIIIGPFTPGFQIMSREIILLGQIGSILILFGLGLEFNYQNFKKYGAHGFLLAGISSLVSFAAGIGIGIFFEWNFPETLLLGTLFVSTSTTMAIQLMSETPLIMIRGSIIAKTAIVVDDLYGFIALALVLARLQSTTGLNEEVVFSIGKVLISIIIIFSVGIFVMPKVFKFIEKVFTGSAFTFGICFCLFLSYGVMMLGISPLIGAFLAGTILTATIQHKDVLTSLRPVRYLFATVFFVSIGLQLNPSIILSVLPLALLISIIAIFSKGLVFSFILTRFRVPLKEAFLCGIITGPRGEISLIITQTASFAGVVSAMFLGIAASFVLLTALISSILLIIFSSTFQYLEKRKIRIANTKICDN